MSLFVVMHEVQLQRAPYAGSANKFRGQPINLVLGTVPTISATPVSRASFPSISASQASVPSIPASPVSQANVPSVSTLPISQDSIITVQQSVTTNTRKIPQFFIPSRFSNDYFSNRNFDEHRNFHQLHGKPDFNDFNEYDY